MLLKFSEGLGQKLVEQWFTRLFTPAMTFWLGGLAIYILRFGTKAIVDVWNGSTVVGQAAILIGGVMLIAGSAFLAELVTLPVLRLLEGYWPSPFNWANRRFRQRQIQQYQRADALWQKLADKDIAQLSTDERRLYAKLDQELMDVPSNLNDFMPTRLGNILRSAETIPADRFGLDAVICWPRLWLVMPAHAREELSQVRMSLNQAVVSWIFSLTFLIWSIWSSWALVVSVIGLLLSYRAATNSASNYRDLVLSAYDLYRLDLYKALHWPLPVSVGEELELGKQLTIFLWRGIGDSAIVFQHPKS